MAGKANVKTVKNRKKLFHRVLAIAIVAIMAGSILLASLLSGWN